jgi:hypothetical protein
MLFPHPDRAAGSRLRFVFRDAVLSFDLARGVTFGDVAGTLDGLSRRHFRHPVAIDLTVPRAFLPRAAMSPTWAGVAAPI